MSLETVACLGVVLAASLILNLLTMVNKLRTGYYAARASLATMLGRGRHSPQTFDMEAAAAPMAPLALASAAPAPQAPLALTLAPAAPAPINCRPGTHTQKQIYKKIIYFHNNIFGIVFSAQGYTRNKPFKIFILASVLIKFKIFILTYLLIDR